jgi:hypothetical protein
MYRDHPVLLPTPAGAREEQMTRRSRRPPGFLGTARGRLESFRVSRRSGVVVSVGGVVGFGAALRVSSLGQCIVIFLFVGIPFPPPIPRESLLLLPSLSVSVGVSVSFYRTPLYNTQSCRPPPLPAPAVVLLLRVAIVVVAMARVANAALRTRNPPPA